MQHTTGQIEKVTAHTVTMYGVRYRADAEQIKGMKPGEWVRFIINNSHPRHAYNVERIPSDKPN